MSSSAVSTPSVSSSSERLTGRVKWFNNKSGYGFITVTDGNKLGSDVFVHHSSIKVDSEQYKFWSRISTISGVWKINSTHSERNNLSSSLNVG